MSNKKIQEAYRRPQHVFELARRPGFSLPFSQKKLKASLGVGRRGAILRFGFEVRSNPQVDPVQVLQPIRLMLGEC